MRAFVDVDHISGSHCKIIHRGTWYIYGLDLMPRAKAADAPAWRCSDVNVKR